MNIHNINLIGSKKGKKYFKYQLFLVVIFSILYWISDCLLSYYPKLSKELLLGYYTHQNPPNPYYYWLWHSLVTQTTVGYTGLISEKGNNISILKLHSNIYKLLNFTQLFSIIITTAILM